MKSIYDVKKIELETIKKIEKTNEGCSVRKINSNYIYPYTLVTVLVDKPYLKIIPNNTLNDKYEIFKIDIDDIEYYGIEGEKYREQVISGGGSGKIDIGGAIIGGLIAGEAGMILGGARKVEEIKSHTVEHDTRHTKLSFMINGERKYMTFSLNLYQYLYDNIPEKDYEVVITKNKNKYIYGENDDKKKLEKLKELYNLNLITKEEYEEKRNEILKNI